MLTVMLARARKQGIEVERRADVPEALPFPDTELCTVLINLPPNALDANVLAPEGAPKWLRVDLHVRGAHLYVGAENSRFAPVDYDRESGLCRSTKEEPSIHGYGLKAVRAVVFPQVPVNGLCQLFLFHRLYPIGQRTGGEGIRHVFLVRGDVKDGAADI